MIAIATILGMVAVARAGNPAKAEPEKPSGTPARQAATSPPAEHPDPATADSQAGAVEAAEAGAEETAEANAAEQMPPHLVGPQHVDLGNDTAIDLPEGMVLLERTEAQDLLRKGGSSVDDVVAMVAKPDSDWVVVIEYDGAGYIEDSDADDLDADDLLESYREGATEQNKRRKALGLPELVVDGWSEPPRYERAQHHLVWGLAGHHVDGKVINFFTRILGRHGYLSVNLIDAPERIEASKKEALAVLQATRFNPGARYEDHVPSDGSSGIGLRGLVLGGAGVAVASKVGFFAKFLLVFKKLFIVVIAAIAGLVRWLLGRRRRADDAIDETPPAAGASPPDDSLPPPDGSAPPDRT